MYGGVTYNTEDKKISQYLTYGNQEVMITGFEIKTASTGSKQVTFKLEGPCTEPGFTPHQDAQFNGRIGKVKFSSYFKDGSQGAQDFQKDIQVIADKLGLKDKIVTITANSLEEYVEKVVSLLGGKPFYMSITGEEYAREGKQPGVVLGKRRYGFAASIAEGLTHLKPFDKTSSYDFKPLTLADAEPIAAGRDIPASALGLPF
jgi:hypothetical protein